MPKAAAKAKETVDMERSWEAVAWDWVKTLVYAVLLALFIRTFFLATFVIPTGSMEPTLRGAMNYGTGDRIIAIKFIYGIPIPFTDRRILTMTEPERGDVVVFKTKGIPALDKKKHLIKRVVGLGGESLQIIPDSMHWDHETGAIRDGGIYINGKRLKEPATIAQRMYHPAGKYGSEEVTVPESHYFMLGDNVLNSRDSRFWGFVPRKNILGKAVAIYWPPKRIGLVR